MIKSRYPNIHGYIDLIDGKTFKEKCYIFINGKNNICPVSGKETKFLNFINGYQKYYSNKESAIGSKDNRLNSMKKAFFEKYGVEHYSHTKEFSEKIKKYHATGKYDYKEIDLKKRETNFKKYGDENYNNLDQSKQTKQERYGNENYNNRKKYKSTLLSRYGVDNINKLPKSKERLSKMAQVGISGFKSPAYKEYLKTNNIDNISQLPSIRNKKSLDRKKTYYNRMVNALLKRNIEPQFTFEEYYGTRSDKWIDYGFKCLDCDTEFESRLGCGEFPYCKKCNPTLIRSKPQFELEEYIKSIYNGKIKSNDRTIIKPYEIDILLPELKLGIELNGIYHHTEINGGKDRKYHLMKTEMVEKEGYRLLHITDSEWFLKRDIVKSIINSIISKPTHIIYANKTKLKEIDSKTANIFLENNHLQGKDNSKIKLGLYHGEELVSIMTFGRSRYGSDAEYEIYRYCNKLNTAIVGGAEKLFKNFIKLYEPRSIKTFSDRRYFTGKVYDKLGFKFIENTPPNYSYTMNYLDLESRRKYQKNQLSKLLEIFDPNKTEFQNMVENGYDRIWDCGNMKFIWKK